MCQSVANARRFIEAGRTPPVTAQGVDLDTPRYLDIGGQVGRSAYQAARAATLSPGRTTSTAADWVEDTLFNRFGPVKRLEIAQRKEHRQG